MFWLGSDKPVPAQFWKIILLTFVVGLLQAVVLKYYLLKRGTMHYIAIHSLGLILIGAGFFNYFKNSLYIILILFLIGAIFGVYQKILINILSKIIK